MAEKWNDTAMFVALGGNKDDSMQPALTDEDVTPDWGWTDEQKQKSVDKHKELGALLDYPPFSINRSKRREFSNDMLQEGIRIHRTGEIDRPYSTMEVRWKDDIDEAILYQKRYGSPLEAQDAAIELNKMDRYKDEDDIYPVPF
jgi:hypothetical protein